MIKAEQRVKKLEQKTGGTKRSIISIARMKRVVRIFDGETFEDMPEHKERIGMNMDDLRKSLTAYYKEEEEGPSVTVINSAVPRPRDRTSLEIANIERKITDDIRDITPGDRQLTDKDQEAFGQIKEDADSEEKPLEERTDEEPGLEAEELSEGELDDLARLSEEELEKKLASMTEEQQRKIYEQLKRGEE